MASKCGVAGCQRNGITYNAAISAAEKAQAWWKYAITSTQNRIGCIILNSHHKHIIHYPEHLFWHLSGFMQEWQAALALLEDLLKPHCKGDGSDDNGPGKEFFGPRLRDSQSYTLGRSFFSHKTFENCSSNIIIEIPLHLTHSWSAIFHSHQKIAAPLGLHATKTAGSQSLTVGWCHQLQCGDQCLWRLRQHLLDVSG